MEGAAILTRVLAFLAATVLCGAPLFALYSGLTPARLRALIAGSGLATALAALAALVLQTGQMAGDPMAGLDPATLRDVVTGGGFGAAAMTRLGAGLAAVTSALALRPGRRLWGLGAMLGAVALGTLPWSGHGAADEGLAGSLHLLADGVHLLAAGVWLGALAGFLLLLGVRQPGPEDVRALHRALAGFSGVGAAAVALIVASGLANSWFLVGPDHLSDLAQTLWGELLLVKLAMFLLMVGLASLNRYRLTPRLEATLAGRPESALGALRRSIALEAALGLAVLILVAVLGTQPPPLAG